MGIYNVVEMTYKKGLLKKLYEKEESKQYIVSQIDNGKHKATQFCRGSGSKYEDKDNESGSEKSVKYKFHIKTEEYPDKIYLKEYCISYWHQFIFYPILRKLFIYEVGGKFRWGILDEDTKKLLNYFSGILNEISPAEITYDYYSNEWKVNIVGDEYVDL